MRTLLFLSLSFCAVVLPAGAANWPQWRGPNRDDVAQETGLLKSWPKEGPPLLWTYTNAGIGYSGPAIVGDRLYLMGARDGTEYVFALDLHSEGKTVKEIWSAKIGPLFTWKANDFNAGPSGTPTVDGELLYALGGQGQLVCVDTTTGSERWRKNLPVDLAAEVNPIGGGPAKTRLGFHLVAVGGRRPLDLCAGWSSRDPGCTRQEDRPGVVAK